MQKQERLCILSTATLVVDNKHKRNLIEWLQNLKTKMFGFLAPQQPQGTVSVDTYQSKQGIEFRSLHHTGNSRQEPKKHY